MPEKTLIPLTVFFLVTTFLFLFLLVTLVVHLRLLWLARQRQNAATTIANQSTDGNNSTGLLDRLFRWTRSTQMVSSTAAMPRNVLVNSSSTVFPGYLPNVITLQPAPSYIEGEPGGRVVDVDMVASLPIIKPQDITSSFMTLSCPICLDDFATLGSGTGSTTTASSVCQLPCGHLYHLHCLQPWLYFRSRVCPLCKADVVQGVMEMDAERYRPGKWHNNTVEERNATLQEGSTLQATTTSHVNPLTRSLMIASAYYQVLVSRRASMPAVARNRSSSLLPITVQDDVRSLLEEVEEGRSVVHQPPGSFPE